MQGPTQDEALRALATVRLPQGEGTIVQAGLIAGFSAEAGQGGLHIKLVLEIDPAQAQEMEQVAAQAKAVLEALDGVAAATVLLTAHRAAPKMGGGKKKEPAVEKKLPEGVKRVIAVAAGKGGVGKSTTSVNLALALARKGFKIGLLDADIYGPSVPRLLGVEGAGLEEDEEGRILPLETQGLKVVSAGFLMEAGAPVIWRGPMIHAALRQMLYDVTWGEIDILLLDMPPGTGDAPLSLAQQVPLAGAAIVSTPQDLALLDVRKSMAMFDRLSVPLLGLIENMSFFECPHCHEKTAIFGAGGARLEAEKRGIPFLGEVPIDLALRLASDEGKPLFLPVYDAIAEKLLAFL